MEETYWAPKVGGVCIRNRNGAPSSNGVRGQRSNDEGKQQLSPLPHKKWRILIESTVGGVFPTLTTGSEPVARVTLYLTDKNKFS